jgi:hypothetical protein
MSKQNTIVAKRLSDGTLVQVLPDGSTKPLEDKTDWARLHAMTDDEVTAAAMSDPDAVPMTPEQLRTARRVPRTKTLRRALALTQEEFVHAIISRWVRCATGSKDAANPTSRPVPTSP